MKQQIDIRIGSIYKFHGKLFTTIAVSQYTITSFFNLVLTTVLYTNINNKIDITEYELQNRCDKVGWD